jgi:hypothetical protein
MRARKPPRAGQAQEGAQPEPQPHPDQAPGVRRSTGRTCLGHDGENPREQRPGCTRDTETLE